LARETPLSGWRVALSGGVDSVVLLAALVDLRRSRKRWRDVPLRALHVHHGLRPAADDWARHCRTLCRELGVPLQVRRVRVASGTGASLEAEARRARYAALERGLRRDEWLLTAHHVDDQLETMLLQWMRGAGVAGLAAMPQRAAFARGWLMRPLLSMSRDELLLLARAQRLAWVEDDSNVDERFERNYVRARVLPILRARWPAAARVAARSAGHLGEAKELLEEIAALDVAGLCAPGGAVELSKLASLSIARQRNALRHWLTARGLTMPDTVHLERIRVELSAARTDAQPLVRWAGGEVRRFRGRLYAFTAAQSAALALRPHEAQRALLQPSLQPSLKLWDWRRRKRFELAENRGVLRLVADPHGNIDGAKLPAKLWVGLRAGGEKIRIVASGPHRAVKELLRNAAVPPWERERLPLLHAQPAGGVSTDASGSAQPASALIAVGDLFVDASVQVRLEAPPTRGRFRLEWEGRFW